MTEEMIAFLIQHNRKRSYAPGEIIFSQGDTAEAFFYLLDGLSLTYTIFPDGRERNILVSWPRQLFGASTFFEGVPRRASAIAVKPCDILAVDAAAYRLCCSRFPTFRDEIIRELSRDIGVLFEELADSSLMSAELRVAQFLCRRLTRRQYSGPADRPQLRFTQSFIASVLGISRVSVGHAISALVRRGWVETTYGGLVIVDVAALRSYAYG